MALVKQMIRQSDGTYTESKNWYWRLSVNGKPQQGSCFTANKSIAARYEAKKRRELEERKLFGKKETLTVQEALQKYMDSMEASGEYQNIGTHLNKLMGIKRDCHRQFVEIHSLPTDKPLHMLSTPDLQRLVMARRKEGNANQTILAELTYLNQAIKLVKKLGYAVPDIDFAEIKRENAIRRAGGRTRWLTVDEEKRLLAELSGDNYDFVVCLLDTGARHTEIAEIEWNSIDLNEKAIHLYRSKVDNESILEMTNRVYEILKRRKSEATGQYVFVARDGTSARNHQPAGLKNAVNRAGLKDVSYHTLRHTFASRFLQNGGTLTELKQILGHATEHTSAIYGHLVPNAAMGKATAILNRLNGG